MNFTSIKVLLVGTEDDCNLIRNALHAVDAPGLDLDWVCTFSEGQASLAAKQHDICLVDYSLDAKTGVEFVQDAIKEGRALPFIIFSSRNGSLMAEALNAGAMDYLSRDELQPAILWRALRYAIDRNKIAKHIPLAFTESADTNNNKARLIAQLSHEMRTPMNGVVGMLDLLEDTELTMKQKEYLAHARTAANSMISMIDRVLDVTPNGIQPDLLEKPVKSVNQGCYKVLLADDSKVTRKVFAHLLEKNGHRVVAVGDGYEAVSCYMKEPFDIILMDLQMPKMNGQNAAKLIRNNELSTKTHTPILALTATESSEDIDQCLQAGMDGYLHKNVTASELLTALAGYVKPSADLSGKSDSPEGAVSPGDGSDLETVLARLVDAFQQRDEGLFEKCSFRLKALALQADMSHLADEAFRIQLAFRRGDMKKVTMLLTSLNNIVKAKKTEKGFKIDMH
ncbi:response regulator [Geobacter pelophilus]|uniref:histidine kinase n=1 Tax=Geoanaerobacter pelophilus TaxID=60036 RepID=A0AAW4L3R5_9BACT|nr:response regulator [Geoanaerobacter pelophilus]MBT0662679.1 response regulator [Geoanaerobacter pelophilus]